VNNSFNSLVKNSLLHPGTKKNRLIASEYAYFPICSSRWQILCKINRQHS